MLTPAEVAALRRQERVTPDQIGDRDPTVPDHGRRRQRTYRSTPALVDLGVWALRLRDDGLTISKIAAVLGVARSTVSRAIAAAQQVES